VKLDATGGATRSDAVAGLELEIGFGHFGHLGGVPVRLLGNIRDRSGRSDLPAGQMPKKADESGIP